VTGGEWERRQSSIISLAQKVVGGERCGGWAGNSSSGGGDACLDGKKEKIGSGVPGWATRLNGLAALLGWRNK
jgi:hypothetical protein